MGRHFDLRQDKEHGDDARQEIAILEIVKHANVAQLLDAWLIDKSYVLVLKHGGLSLRHMLKTERFMPLHTVFSIMAQICAGLGQLHRCDIIHNDLSTSNVLVDPGGSVSLCDFGNSIVHRAGWQGIWTPSLLHKNGLQEITLWYRAPEVLLGLSNYGLPVDTWSAGCIFGELAGGEVPVPAQCRPPLTLPSGNQDTMYMCTHAQRFYF